MQVLPTKLNVKTEVNKSIPPCPKGLEKFTVELDDVTLTVHLEYEPSEKGSFDRGMQMEPNHDESVNIHAVYVDGPTDISTLLSEDQMHEIESMYLYDLHITKEGEYYDDN